MERKLEQVQVEPKQESREPNEWQIWQQVKLKKWKPSKSERVNKKAQIPSFKHSKEVPLR